MSLGMFPAELLAEPAAAACVGPERELDRIAAPSGRRHPVGERFEIGEEAARA